MVKGEVKVEDASSRKLCEELTFAGSGLQTVNLLDLSYGGSSPSPATILSLKSPSVGPAAAPLQKPIFARGAASESGPRPCRWYFVDEIPKTDWGKINRDRVRDHCLEKRS